MDNDTRPPRRLPDLRSKLDELQPAAQPNTTESDTAEPATAESTETNDEIETVHLDELPAANKPSPSWRQKLKQKLDLSWPPGRKEWLVAGVVVLLLIIGGGTVVALTHHSKPVATINKVVAKPKAPPKPTTVPSDLSGLPVAPALNQLPVTGVMIENSTDARPQSGLGQAMVVFEAVAEGGVTRFLALFQDTSPSNVGPIRSARPYYIQWDLGFDAPYAHVGGSPDGLADIKAWGVKDLDEFANGGSYHRISTREAPHNVYTAISTLNQLETSKGYLHSSFTGFSRKAAAPAKTPTAGNINLTLSGPLYNAQYTYMASTNSYNRSEGGAPQIDANTNQQIAPTVVIAMVVPESQGALDATGAYYSNYNVIGSGVAYVFQDGTLTTGTWSKTASNAQLTFTDASGKTIKLDPGQTWLTAVTSTSDVTYTP